MAKPRVLLVALAVLAAAGIGVVAASRTDRSGGGTVASGERAGGRTGGDFHSIVSDPKTPGRLFVGGHEAVSVSTDGGRTWRPIDSLENADAMGWAFADSGTYVSGHPGLNRSTDGARTFRQVNAGLPHTDVHAFGAGRGVLYGAATGAGVFASTDAGASWSVRRGEEGQAFFGRILVDPANDDHALAADARRGVVETTDGGRSWRALGTAPATWLAAAGPEVGVLLASSPNGAFRSTDSGRTWRPLNLPGGASLVEGDPRDVNVLYAGVHDGERVRVLVSRDAGAIWHSP